MVESIGVERSGVPMVGVVAAFGIESGGVGRCCEGDVNGGDTVASVSGGLLSSVRDRSTVWVKSGGK